MYRRLTSLHHLESDCSADRTVCGTVPSASSRIRLLRRPDSLRYGPVCIISNPTAPQTGQSAVRSSLHHLESDCSADRTVCRTVQSASSRIRLLRRLDSLRYGPIRGGTAPIYFLNSRAISPVTSPSDTSVPPFAVTNASASARLANGKKSAPIGPAILLL